MATVSFSLSRSYSPFAFIANAYRRWQLRRLRTCVCSGLHCEPEVDPTVFISRGQYRAAVLVARLQLENAIGKLFMDSVSSRHDRVNVKSTRAPQRVVYLVKRGSFDKSFQQSFASAYGRASRVVHGQHCPKKRAISIVNQVREVLAELTTYERPFPKEMVHPQLTFAPRKVITGFASLPGAANWVLRTAEGVVVDYKQERPRDLEKYVAAFANTLGGMLVFGVTTDGFNRPNWPAVGMKQFENFTASIAQKCTSKIRPAILPNIGELIENKHSPGTKLAVVRVDQSGEAPHAIDSGKSIYIRTSDTSQPFDSADVDQIERMFHRRTVAEAKSTFLFNRHIARFKRFVSAQARGIGRAPLIYLHVCPLFPVSKLLQLDDCLIPGGGLDNRGPDGAWGLQRSTMAVIDSPDARTSEQTTQYTGATVFGEYFVGMRFVSSRELDFIIKLSEVLHWLRRALLNCAVFLRRDSVKHPGQLRIRLGMEGIVEQRLTSEGGVILEYKFPDDTFEAEVACSFDEFAIADFVSPQAAPRIIYELMSQLAHAFNRSTDSLFPHGIV